MIDILLNKIITQEYKLYLANIIKEGEEDGYSKRLGLSDGVADLLDSELSKHFFINHLRTIGYSEEHLIYVRDRWKMCGGFATKRHILDTLEEKGIKFPMPTPLDAQVMVDNSTDEEIATQWGYRRR